MVNKTFVMTDKKNSLMINKTFVMENKKISQW